jgi:tetratricopeptide (TPR) repeat protein
MPTFGVPGTTVTIRGAGFSGFESGSWAKELAGELPPGAVEFNGVPGEILFWQDDLITVKVPIGASTGPVRVVVPGAKLVLTGASFEVPYSERGGSSAHPAGSAGPELSRSSGDETRSESDSAAQGFVNRGNDYYQKKDYRSAINQYDRALAVSANFFDALYWKGFAQLALRQPNDALATLTRLVHSAPANPYSHFALGHAYRSLGRHQNAIGAYRDAVALNSNFAEAHLFLGHSLVAVRDFRDAIVSYQTAASLKPDSVEPLEGLGVAYSRLGIYTEAISATNKILTIAPDDPSTYVSLSWYYSLSDQYQASADAGRMAIKNASDNYMGYTNLCRAYNDLGRYQDALTTCKRALEIKPGDGETCFYLGRAYQRLNQSAKATPLFQKAVAGLFDFIKERPDDADGYYLLGNAYSETKQDEQAVRSYLKAIDLKPRFPQARYNLGVTLHILGRTKEALDQQEQLKTMDPTRATRLLQIVNGR